MSRIEFVRKAPLDRQILGAEPGERRCGACQVCCEVKAITTELNKPQWSLCPHQCTAGCEIYDRRPMDCQDYSCEWLNGLFSEEDRPDRSGLLIDVVNEPGLANATVQLFRIERPLMARIPGPGRSVAVEMPVVTSIREAKENALARRRNLARLEALAHWRPIVIARYRAEVDGGPALLRYGTRQVEAVVEPTPEGGCLLSVLGQ